MTAIVSPKPRHAKAEKPRVLDMPMVPTPPIYMPSEPRATGLLSPPRLMSPINLLNSGISNSKLLKAQSPCSSTKRRRACAPSNSRNSRRRHTRTIDGPLPAFVDGPPVFDRLPWISQVETAPERVDVWDIADLSLLPIDHQDVPSSRCSHLSSGVGPVRHRKSSLRSGGNIFGGSKQEFPSITLGHPNRSRPLSPASTRLLPAFDGPALNPHTPPPMAKINPDEATFRNLMPAFTLSNGADYPSAIVPTYPRGSSATPPP